MGLSTPPIPPCGIVYSSHTPTWDCLLHPYPHVGLSTPSIPPHGIVYSTHIPTRHYLLHPYPHVGLSTPPIPPHGIVYSTHTPQVKLSTPHKSSQGDTPKTLAIHYEKEECVEYLTELGEWVEVLNCGPVDMYTCLYPYNTYKTYRTYLLYMVYTQEST